MELSRVFACRLLVIATFTMGLMFLARAEPPAKHALPVVADWVKKRNENARVLFELMMKMRPVGAAEFGVGGFDVVCV